MSLEAAWKKKRERITCGRGHPIPPYSGFGKVRRCLVCDKASHRAAAKNGNLRADVVRKAIAALESGTPISHLGGLVNGKYYPELFILVPARLKKFCAENPKLGRYILRLVDRNGKAALAEVRRMGSLANALRFPVPAKLSSEGTRKRLLKAVAHVDPRIRENVHGRMVLALYERRLKPKDILGSVQRFVAEEYRMFSMYVPVVGGIMRSTDQLLFDDGQMTLGDTVARGLWDSD